MVTGEFADASPQKEMSRNWGKRPCCAPSGVDYMLVILRSAPREGIRMSKRAFTVKAVWDDEAGVYVCESDIVGLHIEAATVDAFEELMMEFAPELIAANHNAFFKDTGTQKKL